MHSELQLVRTQAIEETANLEQQLHELRTALAEAEMRTESSRSAAALLTEQLTVNEEKIDLLQAREGKAENLIGKQRKFIATKEESVQDLQTQINHLQRSVHQQQKARETEIRDLTLSLDKSE